MHVEVLEVKVQSNWALLVELVGMCLCVQWKAAT